MTHTERIASIEKAMAFLEASPGPSINPPEVRYLLDCLTEADSLRDDLLAAAKFGLLFVENTKYGRTYAVDLTAVRAAIAKAEKAE